jgi:predicted dehydrogenase
LRFGIIGCGWAGTLRAEAIAKLAEVSLAAVSDLDHQRMHEIARRYRAASEEAWQGLISRDDVDAVIVSTPPPLHAEMCIKALDSGKHVLCEKPLARNPDECEQILKASERNDRLLATGFNYRFYPAIVKAREIVDSGKIGELDHIRSFAGHPGGSEFTQAWVHDVKVMGGGALLDNGIHIIDLTRYFLGEVDEVKGYASGHVWNFPGCEDNGFALLKSAQGKVAYLQASWSEWRGYRFFIEIYCKRGCVRASYPPMMTQVVRQDENRNRPDRKIHLFPKFQIIERLRSHRWTAIQSFMQELTGFVHTARGEKTPNGLGLDGLRSVQIAHAVYRSSLNGATIRLDD